MANTNRSPVIHNRQASVYAGPYQVTEQALSYYNVSREKFGTTDILLPDGSSFNVKDYQYLLEDGSVGMLLLPINEYGVFTSAEGKEVWASQVVDSLLRDRMKIKPEDPLYALIHFIHPELNNNTIDGFAKTEKVEMGITHMGAYYGQGVTSNSPPWYHDRRWGVEGEVFNKFGYPCNVMMISMDGVDQAMLNKNFILTDKFLNYGIRFPVDYKSSMFRMSDINTCLMFYRDWILEKDYLKTDSTWFTYCAAHKTLVTTVALNLPHNRQSFMEVYGDQEGSEFYDLFCKNYFALAGEDFTTDLETYFEPLWQKEGLTSQQIKPFTIEEYTAYDEARRNGILDTFTGFKPLKPTQATAWAPQQTADLIHCFVAAYADFIDAGAVVSCATIMAFCDVFSARVGISKSQYLLLALPLIKIIMHAHAKVNVAADPSPNFGDNKYYLAAFEGLYIGYGGKKENLTIAVNNLHLVEKFEGNLPSFIEYLMANNLLPEYLAWSSLADIRSAWSSLISAPAITLEQAYDWLLEERVKAFNTANDFVVSAASGIQYNTPPAIAHMIEVGLFDKNPLINIQSICTVMNHTELEAKSS